GYDWERIAVTFIDENLPELRAKFDFDCEADTFSVQSSKKKILREFAIAFHQFCMDKEAFEKLLKQSLWH
ncbi:MAG: immunity 51 family protein, partial [Acetatifactor sp.]|nr:immunity 51 family protein [Acetatifactor sp.]